MLLEGDVLLFRRPTGLVGRVIAQLGRSLYSHAGVFAWWGLAPMLLETREFRGGRILPLQVGLGGASVDVFRAAALDSRAAYEITDAMRRRGGDEYGWLAILACALRHVPWLRMLVAPNQDDQANGHHPHCSAAVSAAYRAAGLDLVPNLPDYLTEPGDLARSALLQYQFTIVPE
jgi:hypothetical protein